MSARHLLPHQKPVRFSRLKLMSKSPEIYRAQFEEEAADTAAKRFGRLVHATTLGGKIVVYDGERRGNRWAEFKAANEGAEIALEHEIKDATRIAKAVHADPIVCKYGLLDGEHEKEIAWMSEGRACGARLDVLGHDFVTDLKTTSSAEPGWFVRNGARMAYHAQLDWYRLGATLAMGRPIERAFIVAVEPKYPFAVTCFKLPQRTLDMARATWRTWWERLMVCEASDAWPGYALDLVEFEIGEPGEIDFDE